jgi:hypothetical protein
MSGCSQTSIPVLNQITDPCGGEQKKTACIFKTEAITYLNIPPNSSLDVILQNIVLALQSSNTRIDDLEQENLEQAQLIQTLQEDLAALGA